MCSEAVALARALHFSRGAVPIFLAEERVELPLRAVCRAAGLNVPTDDQGPETAAVSYIPMPLTAEACREQAEMVIDEYSPAAVIAVEKLSPNRKGVIHGSTGHDMDSVHAKPQFLFELAKERDILTAGIGDGGNEVGFGVITDAVEEVMPCGRICECPCRGGTAAGIATDAFVVASISNWGAYGVVAMMAYELGELGILVDEEDVDRMLRACVDAGGLDGVTARPTLGDDGVPLEASLGMISILRHMIEIGGRDMVSPGH